MSEIMKDSAIKLFGKTINLNLLPHNFPADDTSTSQHSITTKEESNSMTRSSGQEESIINPCRDETESSEVDDDDDANKEEKSVKKPEKILPCPRCNSMDTKFCYYNNYNVNQPRYFCKKCQRYWTSGGTMRNVPVGSGRRKNKATAAAPNFHHIMVSDAFLISPNSFYPAYWVPTLGKHSREENSVDAAFIPKTLRIDDPNEAAKSSMWSTSLSGTGIFKAFQSKGAAAARTLDNTSMVLQANPAAFSRSINFHERA